MKSGYASRGQAFTEVATALVQESPDRPQLTRPVKPLDRPSPNIQDFSPSIPFGTPLRI